MPILKTAPKNMPGGPLSRVQRGVRLRTSEGAAGKVPPEGACAWSEKSGEKRPPVGRGNSHRRNLRQG